MNLSNAVYCDAISQNARAMFADMGADFVAHPSLADLLWMRQGYRRMYRRLRTYQLLNHIPAERVIFDKGHLTQHLRHFDQTQSQFDCSMHDFYPETYCLHRVADRQRFYARWPLSPADDSVWILKPASLSRGRGVRILWKRDQLDEVDTTERCVVQRYIPNPLLLNGHKSEVRVYWLIASLDPLLVLFYKEGTVRLNSEPFQWGDFDNPLVHVTNVARQKAHPDFESLTLKWDFTTLQRYLTDDLGVGNPDCLEQQVIPQMKQALSFAVYATIKTLRRRPERGLFFGLYGADFILDNALQPWLTEVQIGPGLSFDNDVKQRVIPAMFAEATAIVLEVQRRKRRGESLARLECVDGFEWLIEEG